MRRLLIAVIVVIFVPFTAGAFTVPEEVQVTVPPNSYVEVAPLPPGADVAPFKSATTAPANDKAYKAVKSLDRKLVGKKGMVTMIREKVQNLYSEITTTKTAAANAQTKAEAAMKSANEAKNAVTALDTKLTDKNTGEFKKLKDTAWSVGAELSKDITKMALWIIGVCLVLAIVIIVILIRRTRRADVNLNPLEQRVETANRGIDEVLDEVRAGFAAVHTGIGNIPKQTADLVKTLDLMKIELSDVAGHDVIYMPPIEDNMYVTVYVPSTVSQPVANPDAISRMRMTDKGAVRRSLRKTVADYFTRLANDPNPATEQDRQQKALIEHLIATGELVVS